MNYYNLNGIQSAAPGTNSIVSEWQGGYVLHINDNTSDIDSKLIQVGHRVAAKLFGNLQNFNTLLPTLSTAYPYGGVDAEVKVSKAEFEKWVNSIRSPQNHKILFYYDVQNLIGSLQNLVQESRHLFCEFYKSLNRNSFMLTDRPIQPDILAFASGQIVTGIFSEINHLFINLTSQLDFITKIAFELEHLPLNFDEYPKLKSSGILFGDFKKIKSINFEQTLFDRTEDIQLIISLRNEIIHNSSYEGNPKVYQVFEGNSMKEKFILIPDNSEGIFHSFKNRKRFFDNDTKLNEILPSLLTRFWMKLEATIDNILSAHSADSTENKS